MLVASKHLFLHDNLLPSSHNRLPDQYERLSSCLFDEVPVCISVIYVESTRQDRTHAEHVIRFSHTLKSYGNE